MSGDRSEQQGDVLDLLRLLASCFIVAAHFCSDDKALNLPTFQRAYFATDFFLIVSGFILALAYGAKISSKAIGWGAFMWRRLVRIWPAHAAVLVAFALTRAGANVAGMTLHHEATASGFLSQLALMQAWGLDEGAWEQWNYPTWTLSALVVCYMLFPAAAKLAARIPPLVAGFAAPALLLLTTLAVQSLSPYMLANIPQQYGVFRALPLFMAGMLASRFSSILVGQAKASAILLFCSFGAVGLILLFPAREETSFLGLVAMLGIVAAAAGSDLRFPRWVATGAKLSFALYLVHELTSAVWFSMLGRFEATAHPGALAYIGFALAFVLAVAAAWVLDKFVDGPIQRCLRHNPPKMLAEKLFQMRTKLI